MRDHVPFSSCGLAALLGLFSVLPLQSADWPQWRGPTRDGISKETSLLKEWPKEGPRLAWQVKDLGLGYSTPSIAAGRLYVLGNEGAENEFVEARSAADGKKLWSTRIGKVGSNQGPQYPGARSTPTVDGAVLFALGSDGDLVCLETENGKPAWTKNLRTEFKGVPGNWAYSESPLVDGDTLLCTPGGAEATVVALDKKTGRVRWKAALPDADQASYASASVTTLGGTRQYIQFVQKGVVGLDAATGRLLWHYGKTADGSPANIPTPIVRDNLVYSGAGRSGGGLARIQGSGGKFEATEVYFAVKLPTAIGGAVLVGENLFGTTGQALLCVDFKSGRLQWEDRSVAPASVCAAEGLLYVHSENGPMALVEASPEGYREKGRFVPAPSPDRATARAKAWAYPAIADGHLFLRDMSYLSCYDLRAGK